jgi:hypothetical protein
MSLRRIFLGVWLLSSGAHAQAPSKAECAGAAEKAQTLREEKKLQASRKELLTCSQDACPKAVRLDCVAWLREVEASLPSVAIRARGPDGTDLADVKVSVDGQPLASRLDGSALAVDPGMHLFRFEFADGEVVESKVLVSEGEKNRTILAEKKPRPAPSAPPSAPASAPAAPPGEALKAPAPSVLPWVFLGVGALSAGAFGGLQLWARSQRSDLEDSCGKTRSCTDAQVDPVRTKVLGSGVALGVSVISLGVAGALWIWSPSRNQSVGAAPLPGGASFAYSGSFLPLPRSPETDRAPLVCWRDASLPVLCGAGVHGGV